MAFKCQPGLDTCVTVTPGAHPYTSFNKHRAPASFVIQEQCMVSRESRDERRRAPLGPGTRCRARLSSLHLSFSSLPTSFSWQAVLERDGSRGAKPQLSGRRSHRWARLSQLNPQAAGSDDAQDASYQQDVL